MKIRRILLVVIMVLVVSLAVTNAFAQLRNDTVLSQHIKEADGTSSQNTNAGAGIKTGHIQNGAVTDAKIAGPISATKIADGVFQKKYTSVVVVARGGGDFTDPIAAINSITDASAGNPYLIKIMPGVYDLGPQALSMKSYVDLEGSGRNSTVITSTVSSPSQLALVGTVNGASFSEIRSLTVTNTGSGLTAVAIVNGARLTDIHASTVGAATYSYGIFTNSSVMTNVTVSAQGGTHTNFGIWTDHGDSVLNNVTIVAQGASTGNVGVENYYNNSLSMTNVTILVSDQPGYANNQGVYNFNNAPVMTNVSITASGRGGNFGVINELARPAMSNITAVAKNGAQNQALNIQGYSGGTIFIDRSTLEGSPYSVYVASGWDLKIGGSKLAGGVIGGGTATCVASYDGNYAPLDGACLAP